MTPPRHPYQPGESRADVALEESCPLVVLLATPGSDPSWCARAAISLAGDWAADGRRVFLADLGFSAPTLHREMDLPAGEGVSDLVLYGASLQRVARPAPGGFLFASTGTPVLDAGRVLGAGGWSLFAEGFSRAGAHLVAFLPSTEPGHEAVLEHAERIVVLSAEGEGEEAAAWRDRVSAILVPPMASRPPAPELAGPELAAPEPGRELAAPEPGPEPVAEAEAPSGDPAAAAVAAAAVPATAATAPSAPTTRFERRAPAPRRSRGRVALLVALLAVAVVALLFSMDLVPIPGRGTVAEPGPAASPVAPAVPDAAAPVAEAVSPDQAWFLTLGSYSEGPVAWLQAESLAERRPDLLFLVAPVEVGGEVFHRLLAGAASDSAAATLRQSLGSTLTQEDPDGWIARAAPLSFHAGSYASADAAAERADELRALEIPAFLLHYPGPPDGESWDVWIGAYADAAEAGHLGRVLETSGVEPTLLRRRGELLPR